MASTDPRNSDVVDALFSDARSHPPRASADLHARVLAEGERVAKAHLRGHARTPLQDAVRRVERWFSGWGAGVALAACACFGVWLGYGDPVGLQDTGFGMTGLLEADAPFLDADVAALDSFLLDG